MLTDGQQAELEFWTSEIEKYPGEDYGKIVTSNLEKKMEFWPEWNLPMKGKGLDLGCGPVSIFEGSVLTDANIGNLMWGVDPLLEEYQKLYTPAKRTVCYIPEYRDGVRLPFVNGFFDYIFCINMIDHTEHHALILDEIWRCLKVDGVLFFMVNFDWVLTPPNHTMLWNWETVQKEVGRRMFPERQTVVYNYEHQKYAYWGKFVKVS